MIEKESCYLIGEDHLLIQCGNVLLDERYVLNGIYSPLEEAKEWANQNNIPYYSTYKELEAVLIDSEFDYLFSVANSHIISNTILKHVKKMAINYHDAPLPRHGGANATGFAMLHGEKTHGITWHIINELIDGGDILKQELFKIDNEDTAFSLNLKCYQHGLKLFKELIHELAHNAVVKVEQNMKERIYHHLQDKPKNNGWVCWHDSAEQIELAFRALHMDNYRNKFSNLKFTIEHKAFVILDLILSLDESSAPPGTITRIDHDSWFISTKTKDIILSKVATIDGEEIPLSLVSKQQYIAVGTLIESPSDDLGDFFADLSEQIYKQESFWVKKYQHFKPAEFPFFHYQSQIPLAHKLKTVAKMTPHKNMLSAIQSKYADNYINFFLTIWLIYSYRLGNKHHNGMMLKEENTSVAFDKFISNNMPLSVAFHHDMSFDESFERVKEARKELGTKKGYLRDIFLRYPELHDLPFSSPIEIVINDNKSISHSRSLIFKISTHDQTLSWLIDANLIKQTPHLHATVKNIANHYLLLIESVLADPNIKIREINFISSMEQTKILHTWNDTSVHYSRQQLVPQIIEDMAHKHPNKIAVNYKGELFRYDEINKKSNQLAHYLINKFDNNGHTILVHMDRSPELISTILGILKAGCIYVPVSTTSPPNTIELIVQDSQSPLLLTKKQFKKTLMPIIAEFKITLLALDDIDSIVNTQSNTNPNKPLSRNHLAYVLYTSGTTGTPKGVMTPHGGLVNLILHTIDYLKINNRSRILQFASISFDASIWEILSSLASGASLYIPHQEQLLSGILLKKTIEQKKITCAILSPSVLHTINDYSFSTLKTMVTGGEYCSKELANIWTKKVTLINAYGPTEATVCVTMAKVTKNLETSPPIGRPISNTKAYILDQDRSIVPLGVVGELYISGEGLSQGYLNKTELTKQFFIPNPYSKNKEELFYKTRDLVRWLPDGQIDYIGRIDNQIKIRGFRIELEAIETQIMHHKDIVECAVVAQDSDALGKYLVAYIACKTHTLELKAMHDYLRNVLPEYMIPSFFVTLKSLPITNNGKIDRQKIPPFDPNKRTDFNNYEPPHTMLEERLVTIWSDLLQTNPISINDNFFSLGGHSLLITNLTTYLLDEFNYNLPLQRFFKSPTVSHLAQMIEQKEEHQEDIELHHEIAADKVLPIEIKPLLGANEPIKTLLLTGATGFLGAHLLRDLIQNTSFKVYCLVRAESCAQGIDRIKAELTKYQLDVTDFERIIIICADLSEPMLGLSNKEFEFLADEIDLVYHNGAYVHHLYDYEILRTSNVTSTLELLKLCTHKKNKELHYVSTLSAITDHHNTSNIITEHFVDYSLDIPVDMSGYNQTKLISEYLLSQARQRGIDINIYRPGWIMGQLNTGIMATENNHLLLLLKGCIQIGLAPDWDIVLNILPVDFASSFIVKTSLEKNLKNKVYNLSNDCLQIQWLYLIHSFNKQGFSINIIPAEDWIKKIQKINNRNALYNLLSLYRNEQELQKLMRSVYSKISSQNTLSAMDYLSIDGHMVKDELLFKYISFLKSEQSWANDTLSS